MQFAREFAAGKRVLDAACGEGYGSALLAAQARSVLGVDIADAAVAHARQRYAGLANLRFEQGDCTALALATRSSTWSSRSRRSSTSRRRKRWLPDLRAYSPTDGVLIISSPDKRTYSDVSGFRNEFHVRELYRDELLALLKPQFPFVYLYGQKLLFQSVIWALNGGQDNVQAVTATATANRWTAGLSYDPMYFIAVCSKRPLHDRLPGLALFGDREESVYRHYNGEVRKNMAAGARIAELEDGLKAVRDERDRLAGALDDATSERRP